MEIRQILNCQFKNWYSQFRNVTFQSEILDLPADVQTYLLEDGLVLPEGCEDDLAQKGLSWDSDDDEVNWESENAATTAEAPKFPDFNEKLQKAIEKLGGSIFVKLNWSSPKDASWITLNGTLKCTCPRDIYLLMKSSSFLAHDLVEPFIECVDYDACKKVAVDYYMVLRQWHEISPGYEFRCFAKENKVVAISQRNHSSHFPFLEAEKEQIVQDIQDFHEQNIVTTFPDKTVTFDVFREKEGKVWLVDFNPFGEVTDSLLFTWPELHAIDVDKDADKLPLVRIVDVSTIQPHPLKQYGVPADIMHLTTGQDAHKFIDLMNLKIQGQGGESSSDDDSQNAAK